MPQAAIEATLRDVTTYLLHTKFIALSTAKADQAQIAAQPLPLHILRSTLCALLARLRVCFQTPLRTVSRAWLLIVRDYGRMVCALAGALACVCVRTHARVRGQSLTHRACLCASRFAARRSSRSLRLLLSSSG